MKSVVVCRGCGRTIDSDFIYCPWCSHSRITDTTDSFEEVFARLEKLQDESRDQQLISMEKQLDELETELNMIVLSTEMHK